MKTLIILFSAVLVSGNLLATGIRFTENKDWKTIVALAKKENKIIFLDAYATWCGPCKYLQNSVFTDTSVGDYFNTSFINVKIDMEKGEGPALAEKFGVTAYPTLFFINGDGELVHKNVGALDPSALIGLGKDAFDPQKQYYPLKEKARAGTLQPAAFHDWVHAAEKMDDEDKDKIIADYVSSGNYPLMEEQMLKIVFEHDAKLGSGQLDQLVASKAKVTSILNIDAAEFMSMFMDRVVSYALDQSMKDNKMDFTGFRNVIARYNANKAALETQKMKVVYYGTMDEDSRALDELAILLNGYSPGLSGEDLIKLVSDRAEFIVSANRGAEFLTKVGRFKMLPEETGKEYYKDYALFVLYYFMDDTKKTSEFGLRITANRNAPQNLKDIVARVNNEQ